MGVKFSSASSSSYAVSASSAATRKVDKGDRPVAISWRAASSSPASNRRGSSDGSRGNSGGGDGNTTQERKKNPMKDRSVDVYHETMRQRATSRSEKASYKAVFSQEEREEEDQEERRKQKNKKRDGEMVRSEIETKGEKSPGEAEAAAQEDMPSVRQLRSRFETESPPVDGSSPSSSSSDRTAGASSPVSSSTASGGGEGGRERRKKIQESSSPKQSNRKVGGGGFLVMSSLTRRSALTVGRCVQGYFRKEKEEAEAKAAREKPVKEVETEGKTKKGEEKRMFDHSDVKFGKNGNKNNNVVLPPNDHSQDRDRMIKFDLQEQQQQRQQQQQKQQQQQLNQDVEGPPLVDSDGKWSPLAFVARLYAIQKVDADEVRKNSADAAHIQGHLERLPQGKKKSTVWNTWKRVYAVANVGVLTLYADESRKTPLETVELFGGKAEVVAEGEEETSGDVLLRVVDRREHRLSLRCPRGREEAARWRDALELHARQDFSKTFVVPSPVPANHLSLFTSTLVIDFGGASVRAGVATKVPSLPQLFFPAVMAEERGNEEAKYFGLDCFADEVRLRSKLSHPMIPTVQVKKKKYFPVFTEFSVIAIDMTKYVLLCSIMINCF